MIPCRVAHQRVTLQPTKRLFVKTNFVLSPLFNVAQRFIPPFPLKRVCLTGYAYDSFGMSRAGLRNNPG